MSDPITVFRNGHVLTMAEADPSDRATISRGRPGIADACGRRATSIAVAGSRIVAVGSDADALLEAGPGATVIDLDGATVQPGFIDAHAHPLVEGLTAGQPALGAARTLRDAMRILSDRGSRLPPDAWLEATYETDGWPEGRRPTRDELDRAVHDRPVLLHHSSGHAMVANSLALGMAGLGAGTRDKPGRAVLGRDATGDLDGFVEGSEAYVVFRGAIPAPDDTALADALRLVSSRLTADGVTSVTDADLGATAGIEAELRAIVRAVDIGSFVPCLDLLADLVELAPIADRDPPSPEDVRAAVPAALRARIRLSAGKLFGDGVIGLRTAWLDAPYADDPTTSGAPALPPDELAERVRRAHAAGWQVGVHAIGDAAVRMALDAFEQAMRAEPRPDPRHRIEHAMVVTPALLARAASLGVTLVVQPGFIDPSMDRYADRLGLDRQQHVLPYAGMLERHVSLAFSSDRPFGPGAPLAGVRAALEHAGASGTGARPGFSAAEALHAWTAGAARVSRRDGDVGRILAGASADLVVLDGDPLRDPGAARVRATLVAGRLVDGSLH